MIRFKSTLGVSLLAVAVLLGGCTSGQKRGSDYEPTVGPGMTVSKMMFPTGEKSTSAVMVHVVTPKEVRASTPYPAEVHVTNLTDGTLQNVTVTAKNFDNYTLKDSSPRGTVAADGVSWSLGDLAPHETSVIKANGIAGRAGTAAGRVSVEYNSSLCVSTKVVEPALAVSASGPAEAALCDPFVYKIVVRNSGSGPAANVRVRSTLPQGLATTDGKTSVDLAAGTLSPGESKDFTLNVKAAKAGSYSSSANAVADGGLSAESAAIKTTVRQQVLTLKAECPGDMLFGRNATIKLTVTNTGDASIPLTQAVAMIPLHCEFVSADNGGNPAAGKVTWNLGTLNAKDSRTVSYTVRVTGAGTCQASATASGGCATEATDNCSFKAEGTPDIGTGVTDEAGVVQVGDPHDFTLEVKNQGQVDLTNVTCVVETDEGLDFVSTSLPSGGAQVGRKVTLKFGTIKPGDNKSVRFTVKGTKAAQLQIHMTTTADQIHHDAKDDGSVTYVAK